MKYISNIWYYKPGLELVITLNDIVINRSYFWSDYLDKMETLYPN